jgi:exoribonuclease-2
MSDMLRAKALVLYKLRPAAVGQIDEKIAIELGDGESVRVREKDVELLHPGPLENLAALEPAPPGDVSGAHELLSESGPVPLSELAELAFGAFTPRTAWAAWRLVQDGLYFSGTIQAVRARPASEVAAESAKRAAKETEAAERSAFLDRFRANALDLPADARFLQDVEALAYGQTERSRTLKDMNQPETPENAHARLLAAGVWTETVNPYPSRFGCSIASAKTPLPPPPAEDRLDLTGLTAYAIDNAWSADPDDAVGLDGDALWVHVADPAAGAPADGPVDVEARGRGETLYLPELVARMIEESALRHYALGLSPVSPALSFRLVFDADGNIADVDVAKTLVRVERLTYAQADGRSEEPALAGLFGLAEKRLARRMAAGAVAIDLPEVHISVAGGDVAIEPIADSRAASMVRECMVAAGSGAARWALRQRVPFPFVAQEVGDLPADPLPGLAGAYQLRRCMRPRRLSAQVGPHGGLGLAEYTQVTSPLRRYTDLVAHQQIRAYLAGSGVQTIDEVLARIAAGEAAAQAAVLAERASRRHWTLVYLSRRPDVVWDGVVVDRKGPRATILIPAIAWETQLNLKEEVEPNQSLRLRCQAVRLAQSDAQFVPAG